MKLKHILLGSFCACLIASCSDEIANDGGGQILESQTTTFIRLSLIGDGATRADEAGYENGSQDESAVNSILLTFFDRDKNYVGKTFINVNEDTENVDFNGNGNTVERFLSVVASVTLPQNSNHPSYVVAYVNPTSAYGDLATEKLQDALKFIRGRNTVSHNGYRTMNNSMYFNNDGVLQFATPVDFDKCFFKTKDEAKNAGDDKSIIITVERMEAKVRLSTPINEIGITAVDGVSYADDSYELTFVPEAWFVNGTEKKTFLLKNYRQARKNFIASITDDEDNVPYGLTALNEAFQNRPGFSTVNDITNKRSYWAIDPTYFYEADNTATDIYPDVSYDVKYGESINTNGNDYPLQYRSYTNALTEWQGHTSTNTVKFNGNVKTHEYVLENTMSLTTLRSTDAKAAMTSVVLLGHYVIKKGDTEVFNGKDTNKATAFYVRQDKEKNYVMLSDAEAINNFLEMSKDVDVLYVQQHNQDGTATDEYIPLDAAVLKDGGYGVSASDFSLVYPTTALTGEKIESEQWRTLKVNKESLNIFAKINGENGFVYKSLKNLSDDEFSALELRMYEKLGKIEKFQSGKAYFNVPLKHIWGNINSNNNTFKPEEARLGDYGVVRNHIYDLSIGKISGLGTGIGDIDQPIVPPTENELYYINTKLNILKWRLVKQTVDL